MRSPAPMVTAPARTGRVGRPTAGILLPCAVRALAVLACRPRPSDGATRHPRCDLAGTFRRPSAGQARSGTTAANRPGSQHARPAAVSPPPSGTLCFRHTARQASCHQAVTPPLIFRHPNAHHEPPSQANQPRPSPGTPGNPRSQAHAGQHALSPWCCPKGRGQQARRDHWGSSDRTCVSRVVRSTTSTCRLGSGVQPAWDQPELATTTASGPAR